MENNTLLQQESTEKNMEYIVVGPENAKTTLIVCKSCPYRASNIDKSLLHTLEQTNQPCSIATALIQTNILTKDAVSKLWKKMRNGCFPAHPCNVTNRGMYETASQKKRACGGEWATLYQLRGTDRWTKHMEKQWQAGVFPKVMLAPGSVIAAKDANSLID